MVHGTFYVNVSRLLRLFCKIVDYPSSKIYFILTDRNVETSIWPVVLGKNVCTVLEKDLKDFGVSVISHKMDRLGESAWQLASALGSLVFFIARENVFKYFCVASSCCPLYRTHALRRRYLALNIEICSIATELFQDWEVVKPDSVEYSCNSIVSFLFIDVDLPLPGNGFVDRCLNLLDGIIVFG